MTKYKSAIARAVFILIINIVLGLLYYNYYGQPDINNSLYDIILKPPPYFISLLLILFTSMLNNNDDTLIGYRFTKYTDMLKLKVTDNIKYFAVLFVILSITQIILFCFMDPYFNLISLLCRNFIIYLITVVSSFIVILGKKKYSMYRVLAMCAFLIYGYQQYMNNNQPLIIHRLYEPLYTLNFGTFITSIFTLLLIVAVCIVILQVLQTKKHLIKWLD